MLEFLLDSYAVMETAYYRRFKTGTFLFEGQKLAYFYHQYNNTCNNERAVEIPIAMSMVNKSKDKRILEIGNVLSHYFDIKHDVVDKYEKSDGVINDDVVSYKAGKKYDLIVSISTLEHVGWDEQEDRNPLNMKLKIVDAIKNLESLLDKNGLLIFTVPFGYNPLLDQLLEENKLDLTKVYYFEKVSPDNRWRECSWGDVKKKEYNKPFSAANGIVVGIIKSS